MATTKPRRRTRYTLAQRQDFLAQYQRSGLSARAFVREHSLNLSTLYQWSHKLRAEPSPTPPVFKEVLLSGTSLIASWAAELVVGQDLTLRLGPQVSAGFIAQVIQQLRRPC